MTDEYLIAKKRDMTIRIVKPAEFITRIVDERAPYSQQQAALLIEDVYDPRRTVLCALAFMVILTGFAAALAFGLTAFLSYI